MKPGSLDGMNPKIDDRAVPADKHLRVIAENYGWSKAPAMCQVKNFYAQKTFSLVIWQRGC